MTGTFHRVRGESHRSSRRRAAAVATALGLALIAATAAYARSAGDLDRSFGHHGLRIVRNANDASQDVAVGRKGRIVVAGGRTVARLRRNGRLDRSFADGGVANIGTPSRLYAEGYSSVAVGRQGGVFVAGETCTADERRCGFAVSHLKRDGDVDHSFGHDGTASVEFPGGESFSPSIAIARGGKLLVTGLICPSGYLHDCNLALARLDRHGRLDSSFGNGGKLSASVGPSGKCRSVRAQLSPMALDSRGRIVMGAFCGHTTSLARFTPSGHFDRSFGRRGKVNRRHLGISFLTALTVDPKDRIDVAGPRHSNAYRVVRFQPNGKVSSSFGNHGNATAKFPEKQVEYVYPTSAAVDSRGRIVVAGYAFGFSFARFTAHGHVDRHFGRHGHVVTGHSVVRGSSGQGLYGATSVAIDRRDRIVASGLQRNNREDHFAVVRLLG
jgi:uncharacterized delta-60 repeat protein